MASCFFCHETQHDSDSEDDFATDVPVVPSKPSGRKVSACTDCLVWCPEVYMKGKTWHNIDACLKRVKRMKCSGCGEKNAPLGCSRKGCRKTFHHPCAIKANCIFDDDTFLMSCFVCHEVMAARERKELAAAAQRKQKMELKKRKKKTKKRKPAKKSSKKRRSPPCQNQENRRPTQSIAPPEISWIDISSSSDEDEVVEEDEEEEVVEAGIISFLRPVVGKIFRQLRKDDLPVETVHEALMADDKAAGRDATSRRDLEVALQALETENRIMYREYDGQWTVFMI